MGDQQAGRLCSPTRGARAAQASADAPLCCSAAAGAAAQPDAGQQPARAPLPQVRPPLCLLSVATGWRNDEVPLWGASLKNSHLTRTSNQMFCHVLLQTVCCASQCSFGRHETASADGLSSGVSHCQQCISGQLQSREPYLAPPASVGRLTKTCMASAGLSCPLRPSLTWRPLTGTSMQISQQKLAACTQSSLQLQTGSTSSMQVRSV